jgi:hypothetical protein
MPTKTKLEPLEAKSLKAGSYYRAKRPRRIYDGGYDDRKILWISAERDRVQYDSPVVRLGRHYPTVSMERFLKWVGKEITREEYVNTDTRSK